MGRGELQLLIFLGYQGALWGSAGRQPCSRSHPVGGGGQVAGWAGQVSICGGRHPTTRKVDSKLEEG
jgi:hypothetical protein